jgi:hypothetical protein
MFQSTFQFLQIHFNIILQFTPGPSKCPFLSQVSSPISVHASILPHTFHFLLLLLAQYTIHKISRNGQQYNYIKPTMLSITNCSLVTTLIVLTQLPVLENSLNMFPGSYNGKCVACNCIHFNITHIPCLLLLISNVRPIPVCASER